MRIADTLLRSGHLSEAALNDAWFTGERPSHVDDCAICAERLLDLGRWLDDTKQLAVADADAAFPAERLAAQRGQILRKLEQADRPSRLLSFPGALPAPLAAVAGLPAEAPRGRRVSPAWIAVAAAAGIILGVVADRMSVYQPASIAVQQARVTAPPAVTAPVPVSAEVPQLDEEIDAPHLRSLSALEDLMPQTTVARISTSSRRR